MKTNNRSIKGITRSKVFRKVGDNHNIEVTKELPILTTRYYVFEHSRVISQKRKLNKELKHALKEIKKYELD